MLNQQTSPYKLGQVWLRLACTISFAFAVSSLLGCNVRDRQFQNVPVTMLSPQLTPPSKPLPPKGRQVSVAVIEFKENGRLWSGCDPAHANDFACQEDYAVAFIRNARKLAKTQHKHLVVLTYMHGWRYNASWRSKNFVAFQETIDCLNWGESDYQAAYPFALKNGDARDGQVSCNNVKPARNIMYVGIYLGWRGRSLEPDSLLFWSTVTGREKAASHIADAKDSQVAPTLLRISEAAKQGSDPAHLIVIGHSYGGLILNRVTKQLLEELFVQPGRPCNSAGVLGHPGFADLVVLINPADNSIRAAELMREMLEKQTASANFFCPNEGRTQAYLPRPLVLSLHTASDPYTGWLGVWGFKLFGYDKNYPNRSTLDPLAPKVGRSGDVNDFQPPPTFDALRVDSINHLNFLHTLCYLDQEDNGDELCNRINRTLQSSKLKILVSTSSPSACTTDECKRVRQNQGAYELVMSVCGGTDHDVKDTANADCTMPLELKRQEVNVAMQKAIQTKLAMPSSLDYDQPNALLNLYTRLDVGCKVHGSSDPQDTRPQCGDGFDQQPANPNAAGVDMRNQPSWNTTPYWTANVPYHVIQGHGGFWNHEVFDLITGVSSAWDPIPGAVKSGTE